MSKRIVVSAVLLAVCMTTSGILHAQTREDGSSIARKVRALVAANDYAGLDRLAEGYRSPGAVTVNGESSLMLFYMAISSEHLGYDEHDPDVWQQRTDWAQRWLKHAPDSPTAHVVMGRTLYNRGMSYRMEGPASKVPKANWAPFNRYVGQAADYLVEHKAVASKDPYFYSTLEHAAFRLKRDDLSYKATFDEGARRYPWFFGLFSVVMLYQSPGWGGSLEQVDEAAQHALGLVPKQQRATLYARIYEDLEFNHGLNPYGMRTADWSLASRGMDEILAKYPTQRNIARFAYSACMAEDAPRTARLMKQLTGEPDYRIWRHEVAYDYCLQMSAEKKSTAS